VIGVARRRQRGGGGKRNRENRVTGSEAGALRGWVGWWLGLDHSMAWGLKVGRGCVWLVGAGVWVLGRTFGTPAGG
jgi:hypothetical protein